MNICNQFLSSASTGQQARFYVAKVANKHLVKNSRLKNIHIHQTQHFLNQANKIMEEEEKPQPKSAYIKLSLETKPGQDKKIH